MTDQRRSQPPRQQQAAPAETHWRTIHRRKNADYLFAEDIGPTGTTIDVEIEASGIGQLTDVDGKTTMPWVSFKGARKKLGLNAGNSKLLETMSGTGIVEKWRGWITLVVVRATYTDRKTKQRLTTDAIRIAPERPRNPRKGRYIAELPPPEPEKVVDPSDVEDGAFTDAFGADVPMSDAEKAEAARIERQEQG